MINRNDVINWMEELKSGWVEKRKDDILKLFARTEKYYERPFKPGTTQEEIRVYWNDIDALDDISLDYEIYAIENNIACVHWDNKYTYQNQRYHLDGIYTIKFNESKDCIEFRQWWFQKQ